MATKKRTTFTLYVHQPEFSQEEILINPDLFPGIKVHLAAPDDVPRLTLTQSGDIVEVFQPEKPQKRCYMKLSTTEKTKGPA
jgi:hypothetical protein